MKLKFNRENLKQVISVGFPVLAQKVVIPVLENFHFEVFETHVLITASNLRVSISGFVKLIDKVEDPKSFLINGHKINSILNSPQVAEEVEFIIDKGNIRVKFQNNRARLNIKASANESFPAMKSENPPLHEVSINPSSIVKGISIGSKFVAYDETRPFLSSVHLTNYKGKLTFYASNANIMAKTVFEELEGLGEKFVVSLSRDGAKVISSLETSTDLRTLIYDNMIEFKANNYIVKTILEDPQVEGKYIPDMFEGLVNVHENSRVFNRLDLIDRLTLILSLSTKSVTEKLGKTVIFNMGEETTIEAYDENNIFAAQDFITTTDGQGEGMFRVSDRFLLTILTSIESDRVFIHSDGPAKPVYLLGENEADTYLIMGITLPPKYAN